MYSSIAERLANRLGQKLAKKTPFRTDFVIADYRVLDDDGKTAKVLVQYDEEMFGTPTKEDVVATLTHLYKAQDGRPRLAIDPNTVRDYPNLQVVACLVSLPSIRRPLADVKRFKMKAIVANTVFLGENMTDTWAIAKGENDSVYIERVEKDDIEKILRERTKAHAFRTHAGRSSITLARVENSRGNDIYSIGDIVKCSHSGKTRTGEILGLSDTGAHIRFKDGSQATVGSSNLLGLVQAAEEMKSFNKEQLKEYYRKAYGYGEEELEKLCQHVD
jgi:hypothetical protein